MNPYEQGVKDAKDGKYSNPYPDFSAKFWLYNKGYNSVANPWMSHD